MTPEGRIKAKVKKRLKDFPLIWSFMPVQNGMGAPALDFLLCVPTELSSRFVAIETKAPGKKMTGRQEATAEQIRRAGGRVYVVDDDQSVSRAFDYICAVYLSSNL